MRDFPSIYVTNAFHVKFTVCVCKFNKSKGESTESFVTVACKKSAHRLVTM